MPMRRPTPAARLYAWHRAAMRGENPPIHDGEPECGWFKRRLVKKGPWVPVRIFVSRTLDPETGELAEPEELICEVEGLRRNAASNWTYLTPVSFEAFKLLEYEIQSNSARDSRAPVNLTLEPAGPYG